MSETWRGLRCVLFREIGRRDGRPSPFCHVNIYVLYQIIVTHSANTKLRLLKLGEQGLFAHLYLCLCFSHKLANGKTRRVMSREEFRLLHYAGEVNYNVNGKLSLSFGRLKDTLWWTSGQKEAPDVT